MFLGIQYVSLLAAPSASPARSSRAIPASHPRSGYRWLPPRPACSLVPKIRHTYNGLRPPGLPSQCRKYRGVVWYHVAAGRLRLAMPALEIQDGLRDPSIDGHARANRTFCLATARRGPAGAPTRPGAADFGNKVSYGQY